MQFEIHWESITLYIPNVIDLNLSTLPLLLMTAAVVALRVRKVRRNKKVKALVSNTISTQFGLKDEAKDNSQFNW